MDNHDLHDQSEVDRWIDELLTSPHQGEEILPDEAAMASAGLTHPSDQELERIIQETLNEAEPLPDEPQQTPPEPFKDAEYRDAFGEGQDLEAAFSDTPKKKKQESASSEEPAPENNNGKKRRPKRKKSYNLFGLPHILSTVIWLAVVAAIGISLGNMIWVCASDVLAFGREHREITVTINEDDTIAVISQKLYDAGLIRYPNLFSFYAKMSGAREDISSGTFTLNTMYDYHALVNFMSSNSSEREIVEVVIPEGYTCAQIFNLLEDEQVCTVADLEEYAASGELDDYWFLEGVERGDRYCLEGFLFPDTYEFYTDDEPRRVLEKLLDDFDYRFTDEMRQSLDELNVRLSEWMAENGHDQAYINDNQLDIRQLVTVASLIEKETANTLESYTISSVIYNRLFNWGDTPAFLNIDAAIIYALGEHKEELTQSDLEIDSPYNTYTHTGLTPGPICNPGLHSLNAALDPDDTDYYFYAIDPSSGEHHFSETSDEHNTFLASLEDE